MKICAIICEYNPFHNGHLYQLNEAKKRSGADAILCVMSGNFTQRGEAAILEKHIRAKHAVLAGADAVLELPTPFATSNAELFAKGGVKLLASIPEVSTICFGAERADKKAFEKTAQILNDEPQAVSEKIKALMATGRSYANARAEAYKGIIPEELLFYPNNILGLEYSKAILESNRNIELLPIQRVGGNYNDENLYEDFSSASAIRLALTEGKQLNSNLPSFVSDDLPQKSENNLEQFKKYAILSTPKEEIAKVCDCGEGLENAFKKVAALPPSLTQSLTSARYTASRIRRIGLQNLLGIKEELIRKSLSSPLYLRLLAIKKEKNELLSAISKSQFPLLVRAHDEEVLQDWAKKCYEIDLFAEKIYSLLYPNTQNTKKNIFI